MTLISRLLALPPHSSERSSRNKEGPPRSCDPGHLSNQPPFQPCGLSQPAAHVLLPPETSRWHSVVNITSKVCPRPWGESFSFRMLSEEKPLQSSGHLFRTAHSPSLCTACLSFLLRHAAVGIEWLRETVIQVLSSRPGGTGTQVGLVWVLVVVCLFVFFFTLFRSYCRHTAIVGTPTTLL